MMSVVRETMKYCKYCLAMPNTDPPLMTAMDCTQYLDKINEMVKILKLHHTPCVPGFKPLVAMYINENTTAKRIHDAADAGIVAGKLYPRGRTTGSDLGITDYERTEPALRAMEERDMVCCLHGEHPKPHDFCTVLDWEAEFVSKIYPRIVRGFPRLRIVLEHITTEYAVAQVKALGQGREAPLAATITAHHLRHTIDNILANGIQPHNYCKPIAKLPRDLISLRKTATSGDPRFFLGSDSAPHPVSAKETCCGCAGCFTAAYLPAHIAGVFDEVCGNADWTGQYLPDPEATLLPNPFAQFTANNAMRFYGLDSWDDRLRLTSGTRIIEVLGKYGEHQVFNWRAGGRIGWGFEE
jgi:dihydroorotase